ncbi:hypothetical protein AB0K00_10905 [Dactylosporangium sp. NPDC049525]|uniref:hypothetical protein n=1 Tax=Dactylosporangium sp. NPDC049525 TaxID=3154730 RepID=UPI0034202EC6
MPFIPADPVPITLRGGASFLISRQDPQLRQLRLDEFNGWIAEQPAVKSSGYIASVFDVPNLAITVLWFGGDSAFRQQIAAEGARRGITVRFEARKQSLAQTEAAARALVGLVCSDTVFLTAMRTIVNAQPGASLRVY